MHYVITCLVTRNTLLALAVLIFLFVLLGYLPAVLVYLLVVLVCPFVVLLVLSVGLFITDPIIQKICVSKINTTQ